LLTLADVVLEAERAAHDLVRRRLVDAALAVGARVDARDVARRRNEDVALVRVVDLDPREVVRAVLRIARLGQLVDAAGDRLGRVEHREAILARLGVREQRILDRRRHLTGRGDDRDLVDLVEALEAGASTGATVTADVEAVAAGACGDRRGRLLVLLVARGRGRRLDRRGHLGSADIDDEAARAAVVEEAVDRVAEVLRAVLEIAERL